MLRSLKELNGFIVGATDGQIGSIKDFYFDDQEWVVRYVIVETGGWIDSRRVLISPIAIGPPDWLGKVLPVSITLRQVEDSPNIDTDKPVSRQYEVQYSGYYGYPHYWSGAGSWGAGMYPNLMLPEIAVSESSLDCHASLQNSDNEGESQNDRNEDSHLRCCHEVMSYQIHASDGALGHVSGLIVDYDSWSIRYLIVSTRSWGLGHQVLISTQWIDAVNWFELKVELNITRQAIKDAPPYDSALPLDRSDELGLHEHYKRPGYWSADIAQETSKSTE